MQQSGPLTRNMYSFQVIPFKKLKVDVISDLPGYTKKRYNSSLNGTDPVSFSNSVILIINFRAVVP